MPLAIYVLGFAIFSMTTSEFMVAGMMPSLAAEFEVSVATVGYLISAYAAGMVVGGPLLTIGLLKVPQKQAIQALISVFLIGQIMGALATNYEIMFMARVITGIASSASFGVSIAICANLVSPQSLGRAASIVVGGLMVATVVGLPAATLIDQFFGWRASFWTVAAFVLLSGLAVQLMVPSLPKPESIRIHSELAAFRNRKLWAAYLTSMLIIGATFAAFSYFAPILTDLAGFATKTVPFLLAIYGLATVIGNMITGRFADHYTIRVLTIGLITLTVALTIFAFFAQSATITIIAMIVIGLVGVPMNPAMATRVMKASNSGALVNTVHTSFITLGIVVGSSIGGLTINAGYGLVSPLWVGTFLAILGLLSLLPFLGKANLASNEA